MQKPKVLPPRLQRHDPDPWQLVMGQLQLAALFEKLRGNPGESGRVAVGDQVTLFCLEEHVNYRCRLVDADSACPQDARISCFSPLGSAIIGRKVGDRVSITLFGRSHHLIITQLEKTAKK